MNKTLVGYCIYWRMWYKVGEEEFWYKWRIYDIPRPRIYKSRVCAEEALAEFQKTVRKDKFKIIPLHTFENLDND